MTAPQQLSLDFDSGLPVSACVSHDDDWTLKKPAAQQAQCSPAAEPPPKKHVETPVDQHFAPVIGEPNGFSMVPGTDLCGKPEPIPYQLKVSAKARQVYLRVEPGRGLQVSIPKRYPKRSIPALVESQRAWIVESLIDLDQKTLPLYRQWPPSQLDLLASGQLVDIYYRKNPEPEHASWSWPSENRLHLSVDTHNKPLVASCIADALKPVAKQLLEPWLQRCARVSRLRYRKMSIRGQRTVWGSYSSTGTLSLNYKLLFLRAELVDYVLLHELAHTRHLDHSAAFWRFLDELKPDAAKFDRELNDAGSLVPPWLELAGAA